MGLERALGYLENLRFTAEEIAYLATVPALRDAMTPAFVDYLRALRFTGDVDAMPEGTAAFANEPLLRVRGPLVEAQLVETFLLSAVNHATMIASKAARVVESAGTAAVIEFGTRRTHPDAAVDAARAAYAAGFAATSNVEAGRRFGVPVTGTAAHMWTMAHDSEEEAFAGYTAVFPNASILLIDTYDTLRGAERAAKVAGDKLKGVRLDSGDLLELSRAVRVILDENGCKTAQIVASGDLNEIRIAELRAAGAPIDSYGVGTDLVTSLDAPALGGVYKLVELTQNGKTRPIAKFSEGKGTFPGAHQVLRFHDAAGKITRDMVTLDGEVADPSWGDSPVPLLIPVMRGGKRVAPAEPLAAIRARAAASRASLPADLHLLEDPTPSWVGLAPHTSPRLSALVAEVRAAYASPQKEAR